MSCHHPGPGPKVDEVGVARMGAGRRPRKAERNRGAEAPSASGAGKLTRRELLALAAPYSGAVAALLASACGGRRGGGGGGGDDDDDDSGPLCTDTCTYAADGECDDGGEGSTFDVCDLGTDCTDCGPRDGGYVEYAEYPDAYAEYSEYSEGYYNYPDDPYYELYPNYDNYSG